MGAGCDGRAAAVARKQDADEDEDEDEGEDEDEDEDENEDEVVVVMVLSGVRAASPADGKIRGGRRLPPGASAVGLLPGGVGVGRRGAVRGAHSSGGGCASAGC